MGPSVLVLSDLRIFLCDKGYQSRGYGSHQERSREVLMKCRGAQARNKVDFVTKLAAETSAYSLSLTRLASHVLAHTFL